MNTPNNQWRAFLANLRAGTRLALWRPLAADDFRFTLSQVALFLSIEVGILLVYDYEAAGPAPRFNIYGVTETATHYLLFFASVFLIARAFNDTTAARKLALVLLAASPLMTGVYLIAAALPGGDQLHAGWALWVLAAIWACAVAARATALLCAASFSGIGGAALLFAAFNYGSVLALPNQPLWYAYESADQAQPPINVEDTYYRQWSLLESVRVAPGRPGVTDLYFVGFGSYAGQDVFRKEVDYARRLFDRDYGTGGRSVTLINSPSTLETTPLATAHNLRRVLRDIGTKMNTDEDILFLFLTSHGSRNADLAVEFWPLAPNDLNAGELAAMLDDSGIQWRVIVVSACYSGSFIEPLRSDKTLLMTAAHRDRQSFGCSNTRDFTYFGEAYFGDALHRQRSFIAAFEDARDMIERREIAESKPPSRPQIFIGSRIETRLAAYRAETGR